MQKHKLGLKMPFTVQTIKHSKSSKLASVASRLQKIHVWATVCTRDVARREISKENNPGEVSPREQREGVMASVKELPPLPGNLTIPVPRIPSRQRARLKTFLFPSLF